MQSQTFRNCHGFASALVLCAIMLGAALQSAYAQAPQYYGFPVLENSPGAVVNGMGGGSVVAGADASAIYYNPAALTRCGRMALAGNTFKLFPQDDWENFRFSHLAAVVRTGWLRGLWLGAAYSRVGLGQYVVTGETTPDILGVIKPYEWSLAFAAAIKSGEHMRFGIGFKYLRREPFPNAVFPSQQGGDHISGYGFDLGFLYDGFLPRAHFAPASLRKSLPWSKWAHKNLPPGFSLGIALANLGPQVEFLDGGWKEPLPQNLRVGLAWNILESDVVCVAATGEFNKRLIKFNDEGEAEGALPAIFTAWSDQSIRDEFGEAIYRGGVEIKLLQLAALRYGRHWDGRNIYGYNTLGYAIGPSLLQFSVANFFIEGRSFRTFYSITLVLNKLR